MLRLKGGLRTLCIGTALISAFIVVFHTSRPVDPYGWHAAMVDLQCNFANCTLPSTSNAENNKTSSSDPNKAAVKPIINTSKLKSSSSSVVPVYMRRLKIDKREGYVLIRNFLLPSKIYRGNESVTLATHATASLLHHLVPLSERWQGPVVVTIYAPGTDLLTVVAYSLYLRNCASSAIRDFVTFHAFSESVHATVNVTHALLENVKKGSDCSKEFVIPSTPSYKDAHSLPYHINVARNVARQTSRTHFVLLSDIELYPSLNVIPMFLHLVTSTNESSALTLSPHRAYVLPIFEVKKELSVPDDKETLMRLYSKGDAISFHKFVCNRCSMIPSLDSWIKTPPAQNDSINVFHKAKRHGAFQRWEPIFIGTKNEPLYDIRLTWEGYQDKMTQMYEMCLLDYDLFILDNAFLVHAPGIKKINNTEKKMRSPHISRNNKVHDQLIKVLQKKYGRRSGCGR